MRRPRLIIAAAGGLMLAGCLVSDDPLFDAETGSAAPMQSGRHKACSAPSNGETPECDLVDVTRRDDGAYDFFIDETDQIVVRFHEIDAVTYAAQFEDDDGDGFQYYWAAREGDTLSLAMIWCEDLPESLRNAMRDDGLIAFEEGGSTCTALKPEAVVRAAGAYRDGLATPDSAVRLTLVQ